MQRAIGPQVIGALFLLGGVEIVLVALGVGVLPRRHDIGREIVDRRGEVGLEIRARNRLDRITAGVKPVVGVLPAQHHARVGEEVAVDVNLDVTVLARQRDGRGLGPRAIAGHVARQALAQEDDVGGDHRSGVLHERIARQADRTNEVCPVGEVFPRAGIQLVHGAGAGDERQQAARSDGIERLGKEIIVKQEALLVLWIALDRHVSKRRIADYEVVAVLGQPGLGEIVLAHAVIGIQILGDARGDVIELNALIVRVGRDVLRHHAGEIADTHAGLEHLSAGEAHLGDGAPHRSHYILGGIVRVLDRAAGGGVLLVGQHAAQLAAKLSEALAVSAALVGEDVLDATPANIFGKVGLIEGVGRSAKEVELLDDLKCFDVVARLGLLASAFIERAGLDDEVLAYCVCGSFCRALRSSIWRVVCSWFGKSSITAITCSIASRASGSLGYPPSVFGAFAVRSWNSLLASAAFWSTNAISVPSRLSRLNIFGACWRIACRYGSLNSIGLSCLNDRLFLRSRKAVHQLVLLSRGQVVIRRLALAGDLEHQPGGKISVPIGVFAVLHHRQLVQDLGPGRGVPL